MKVGAGSNYVRYSKNLSNRDNPQGRIYPEIIVRSTIMRPIEEFPNYFITDDGSVYNKDKVLLEKQVSHRGYNVINLYKNGRYWHRRCARLVGLSYHANTYQEGLVINHKDLDKQNDNSSNLEWVTSSGNFHHSFYNQPEKHQGNRQHSEEIIRDLCFLLEQGYQRRSIGAILGVQEHLVKRVKNRVYWVWISDDFNFNTIGRGVSENTMRWVKICIKKGWEDSRILANKPCKLLTKDFLSKVRSGYYWSDIIID